MTGKFDGENETTKTFNYGVDTSGYTWNNGMLVIKDIKPGTYTVTEQKDGVDSVFAGDTSGKTYTHTSTCTVSTGTGTVSNGVANATVAEGELTTVSFVNNYDEAQEGALKITKNVTVNGSPTGTTEADGTYTFTIASTDNPDVVLKYVRITVSNGVAVSYQVSDNPDFADAGSVEGAFAIVSELSEGDYVITETATEGMSVSSITGGKLTEGKNDAVTSARTVTAHVTAGDTTAVQAGAAVEYTNNKTFVDIRVIKIDENTRNGGSMTKLPAAEFQLYRYTVNEGSTIGLYTVYPDEAGSKKTTSNVEGDNYGSLVYGSLPDGQYKLSETKAPAGYILTQNNDVYFDIVQGVVTRYAGAYTGTARDIEEPIEASDVIISETSNVALITYSQATGTVPATFTIGNTPGVALPSTGGSGTAWLKILGMVLVATGGTGIVLQRKRHYRG